MKKTVKPRMTAESIETMKRILDSWTGILTWDRYLKEVKFVLGHSYSKVAMLNRPDIAAEWEAAKKRLPAKAVRAEDALVRKSLNDLVAVTNENERLRRENDALKVKFLRWSANAYERHGMTEAELDNERPMPERRATRGKPLRSAKE